MEFDTPLQKYWAIKLAAKSNYDREDSSAKIIKAFEEKKLHICTVDRKACVVYIEDKCSIVELLSGILHVSEWVDQKMLHSVRI